MGYRLPPDGKPIALLTLRRYDIYFWHFDLMQSSAKFSVQSTDDEEEKRVWLGVES